MFSLFFSSLAVTFGCASILNARLAIRYGMQLLSFGALFFLMGHSLIFLILAFLFKGHPPFWLFIIYLSLSFFAIGVIFGNMNALAMEPLGNIAGIGAAVVRSLSLSISLCLGTIIGQLYNGTVIPLIGGFSVLSALSMAVMGWVNSKKVILHK